MLYVLMALIIVVVSVMLVPLIVYRNDSKERLNTAGMIEYTFPKELFEENLGNLKCERISGSKYGKLRIQDRGSIRIAQGRILSNEELEEKRASVYAVTLP